jgi:cholestenol Delta-isomerase
MDAAGLSLGQQQQQQQQLQQLLQQHPYYPPAVAIPGYTPNASPVLQLISLFGAIVAVVIVVAYNAASRPGSRFIDRFAAAWFGLCALLRSSGTG